MSALARIDSAVLGWHQDLVDALQRRPLWFARLCFAGIAVCELGLHAVTTTTLFAKVASAVLLLLLFVDTRSESALVRGPRSRGPRLFGAAMVLFFLLLAALYPAPARAFHLGTVVLLTAFMNFAACRPPRPRPPRMATAGGAA